MTHEHVTWADSPYIVTLKASDKRDGVVRAGNLEAENRTKTQRGCHSATGRPVDKVADLFVLEYFHSTQFYGPWVTLGPFIIPVWPTYIKT